MSNWTKLPPLTVEQAGFRSGCLTCGPQPVTLALDACIAVGFGAAGVTKDGETVWEFDMNAEPDDSECMLVRFENMAAVDPDHDWRAFFHGPLSEAEYQRQDVASWVLVKKGMGFA